MGKAMSEAAPAAGAPVGEQISIARLHGEACYDCGAVHGLLVPAGTVTTPVEGGEREWPIVACPEHVARVQS
jgi:hypothetical protein